MTSNTQRAIIAVRVMDMICWPISVWQLRMHP